MGGSFTPELIRLLREAGCRFERPGKGECGSLWMAGSNQGTPRMPCYGKPGCRSIFEDDMWKWIRDEAIAYECVREVIIRAD